MLERQTGLQDAAETGVMIEADLTVDLLTTIFTPRAPLHDGAVIVRGDRIVAAGASCHCPRRRSTANASVRATARR